MVLTANDEQMLDRAIELIRAGWCKGAFARNSEGQKVLAGDRDAVSFSILGALQRAIHEQYKKEDPLVVFRPMVPPRVSMAIRGNLPEGHINTPRFNDDPSTRIEKVLEVLEDARFTLRLMP